MSKDNKEIERKIEEEYDKEVLIDNAKKIFGVNSEILAGALSGVSKGRLTLNEAKSYLEKFLKKEAR
jgi:hypothetical protein